MEKRIIKLNNKYESMIFVIDKLKLIYKLHCTCGDFINRRLKSVGEFSDKKSVQNPCKHLNPIVEALQKQGYKLKVPTEMKGSEKLTKPMKKKLMERANFKCESLRCGEVDFLQVHRKTRGSAGGKYNTENCIVLCHECHRLRHANEFPGSKSK